MTRVLLCVTFLSVSLLMRGVKCEDDGNESTGLWERLRELLRSVVEELKKLWSDFKTELNARMSDMGAWSQEAWDGLKRRMTQWVDDRNDISESEKSEMRNYIERMQMPEEKSEEKSE